jgi:hypothetical protein
MVLRAGDGMPVHVVCAEGTPVQVVQDLDVPIDTHAPPQLAHYDVLIPPERLLRKSRRVRFQPVGEIAEGKLQRFGRHLFVKAEEVGLGAGTAFPKRPAAPCPVLGVTQEAPRGGKVVLEQVRHAELSGAFLAGATPDPDFHSHRREGGVGVHEQGEAVFQTHQAPRQSYLSECGRVSGGTGSRLRTLGTRGNGEQ